MSEGVSRIEVLDGPSGRRRWPDDLKARIVTKVFSPARGSASFACGARLPPGARDGLGGCSEEGAVIFPDQAIRIVIATRPVDFRKGDDGLPAMAHAELGFAPKAGVMVVFRSRRGDRIKVLFWDGSGVRRCLQVSIGAVFMHPDRLGLPLQNDSDHLVNMGNRGVRAV